VGATATRHVASASSRSIVSTGSSSSGSNLVAVGPPGGPAVLLLHSWWGINTSVHAWATILADAGHHVLVPDLFHGRTANTVAQAEALVASVGQEHSQDVAQQAADQLSAQGQPWAAIGFSLGALFACRLTGRGSAGPDEVHLFYGGSDPGGPVSRTRRAFLHVVPDDPYFTALELATTQRALGDAHVAVETFTYRNSHHWFAEPDTPGYDKAAFALARSRVTADLKT